MLSPGLVILVDVAAFDSKSFGFFSIWLKSWTNFSWQDKTQGHVFHFRSGRMFAMHMCWYEAKWPNLTLKTHPKKLLGSRQLASTLPN